MGWIDNLSRRIGEKKVKDMIECEAEIQTPDIKQELDILEELRQELIKKDAELNRTRLEWDRTFDSIVDNIVLIDRERKITKANSAFYECVEREIGHVEYIGMDWQEFKRIAKVPVDACTVDKCFETGLHQEAVIEIRGKTMAVSANPVYVQTNGSSEIIGVVRVSRDVTKIEKTKCKLERRSGIYHAIADMSKTLVNHENWGNAVSLILGDLGRAIGASRVYMFKNEVRENRICSIRQHVYHNGKTRQCDSGTITDCINYDMIPEWKNKMEHGLPVEGSLVECHICPNKTECVCQDDVLVCAVPIFVKGEWWGFMGFDYQNGTRIWKDEDETLLRIAADIIGGVIYHRGRYYETVDVLEECEDLLEFVKGK